MKWTVTLVAETAMLGADRWTWIRVRSRALTIRKTGHCLRDVARVMIAGLGRKAATERRPEEGQGRGGGGHRSRLWIARSSVFTDSEGAAPLLRRATTVSILTMSTAPRAFRTSIRLCESLW